MNTGEFAFLLAEFGEPQTAETFDPRVAESCRGRLPDSLIDFMQRYGTGIWLDGKFQFCRPDMFSSLICELFSGDPDLEPSDLTAYGYSAFGKVLVWSRSAYGVEIDLPFLNVQCRGLTSPRQKQTQLRLGPDRAVATSLTFLDQPAYDGTDTAGKPLFSRALKEIGKVSLGECYGFVPALLCGGKAELGHLQRVKALSHFEYLAGLGPLTLVDYSTGRQRFVRNIGPV